jgi:RNA polymerase sigma-70 factor (family 1)
MFKDYSNYDFLLKSLKNNDLEAIKYLYNHQRDRLFILANSILEDHEASKDLVQEVFLEFLQTRQFDKIESALKTYLFRLVRNRAINLARDRSIRLRQQKRFITEKQFQIEATETELIEYNLDKEEIRKEIENAIGNLPPMAEKVFRLHYLQQLSHIEIANKLSISRFTVSNHMDRALKGLRAMLKSSS